MGCVESAEQKASRQIEKDAKEEHKRDAETKKLLLLGAGESGKSTLFKQILNMYGTGFTEEDIMEYKRIAHNNLISCMKTVLKQTKILKEKFPDVEGDLNVTPDNAESMKFIEDYPSESPVTAEVANHIQQLWADPGVKLTFENRGKFQIPDCAEYFFDAAERLSVDGYKPSTDDVMRCRVRTTGIVEMEFKHKDVNFQMIDVGGQRNERKKWIHCFEDVTSVMFVAALSEYDQVIFEDETTPRIEEALDLFEEICALEWFKDKSLILFMNKKDLFNTKIISHPKYNFKDYFPEYKGAYDYDSIRKYLADLFVKRNKNKDRSILVHYTQAVSERNVKRVFMAVSSVILEANISQGMG